MASSDLLATADRLIAGGRAEEAVALVTTAAHQGDGDALFALGFWHVVGEILPRDLALARDALSKAAAVGHHDAQLMDAALTANGSGSSPDWATALERLRRAATDNPDAAAVMALLKAMTLTSLGTPRQVPSGQTLTPGGTVIRVPGFLSKAECAHLAGGVADILAPSCVVDPTSGRVIANPIRTSDEALIGPLREDLAVRAINHRIAAISRTPVAAGEALTILRYSPGQQFRLHSDILGVSRNQRIKTVLIYLNDGFRGGETVFPDYGLSIEPVAGDAVVFTNTLADGRPDPRARHAGLPVITGTKWLATRWIRARPFDMWAGPESAD